MLRQWWPTNLKYIFSVTRRLCAWAECIGSQVIRFTWIWPNPQRSNVFIQVRNIRFTDTWHLVLLDTLFVLKVKLVTFLSIHRCAFGFNLKYIFVSFYASRTLRLKLLIWCRLISLAGLFESGLKFVKIFRACIQNFFYNIKSNDFFLSWRRFVVLNAVTSVSELIVIFVQLILFANTVAFCYSLQELISHCFWEGESGEEISTRWCCVENINQSRDSWLVSRSLQAGFSYP